MRRISLHKVLIYRLSEVAGTIFGNIRRCLNVDISALESSYLFLDITGKFAKIREAKKKDNEKLWNVRVFWSDN